MALIHVFDGINKHTSYTFSGKIKDHINNVDWENSVILKGGYRIDENYEVQPDDVLYIRKTPAAAVSLAAWGVIAGVTALVGAGVAVGVSIYNNKKAMAAMEDAQKASKAAADTSGKLPFIKGARNQAATGRSFPYAIGESLMTPYRLCPPHYTIAGERGDEQYYNVVLEVAYNNILIKKIKMGETIIKNFSGVSEPQNGQYAFDEGGIYYDARNLIEIRQNGEFLDPEFNKKIVLTELNEEIPHDHAGNDPIENERIETEWKAGVVQKLASHAQAVELIALFDGLQQYDDGWKPQTISLRPQWTNADNPSESDWNDFTNGFNQNGTYNNTFTYNTKKQMRYKARQEFTAAQAFNKNMKVRVIRTTPKADSSAKDSVYLLAVQTYCYDAKKSSSSQLVAADVLEPTERDKCCRIGVRVAANVNTTGLLDAISVIESGCARIWNGTAWSSTKKPTRNLAAWVLELMTSPQHKPSQYDDAELDLASFGAWYMYCQLQGFNADGVITKSAKKKQIIETLCKNGNAALVYNSMTGKIEVAIDNGRDYSIALLNSENIINISTAKEFKRKTTGKKVTYINAAADYDADSVIFMRDGEEYDPATDTLTEAALEYVTDYQHAFKIAWRQMAEESAQPKIYTVKAGLESAYYPLYSRVELQHKSLKIGIANGIIKALVWRNRYLQEIHLDGAVTFPATGACGVIINCVSDNGRGLLALKVSGSGKTNILHVETSLRNNAALIPTAGNNISFGKLDSNGEFTTVTSTCKITNAEESDNGYTLTLVDYNPALYQYGALPEYRSNLTNIPTGKAQTVEGQREYVTAGESEANVAAAAQVVSDEITKGTRFTNIYKIRPVDMSLEDVIKKMDDDARNASASISMSADEILLQVQSLDEQQRAFIALTKEQILAQVDDMAQELTGLVNVQAGAVTALVEGGGAAGEMSLSLNLPILITAATRAQFVAASTEAKVAAVYALIENTTYYGIKGNADTGAIKALWDDAIKAGLIASQIELQADQIYIDGDVILNDEKKIKASLIDVENILARQVIVKDKGVIKSSNYNGEIDVNGNIVKYGNAGWAVDHNGKSDFVNINATNGNFNGTIDTGALKVSKEDIKFHIAEYGTTDSDAERLWNHFMDFVPAYTETIVTPLDYGERIKFYIDNNIELQYIKVYYDINRASHGSVRGYDANGTEYLISVLTGSISYIYIMHCNFYIDYEGQGIAIVRFNELPTADPKIKGVAWLNNNVLTVSAG